MDAKKKRYVMINEKKKGDMRMKERSNQIISLVLCVLLVLSLVRMESLKREVEEMRGEWKNGLAYMERTVDNISSNVTARVAEENNLLVSSQWQFTNLDAKKKTAVVQCQVVPKEYSKEGTTATLYCDTTAYPMQLENGQFTAKLTIPLLETTTVNKIQFCEQDTIRTQQVEWYWNPIDARIGVSAMFVGAWNKDASDQSRIQHQGDIEIYIDKIEDKASIQSVAVVSYINEKEIKRQAVPLDATEPSHDVSLPDAQKTSGTKAASVASVEQAETSLHLYAPIDETIKVPKDSMYEIWVEVVDQYGLFHRACVSRNRRIAESAVQNMDAGDGQASVYDADLNVIYIP